MKDMKRWAAQITCLYFLIIVVLTAPAVRLSFRGTGMQDSISASTVFGEWSYWLWVIAMAAGQYALLFLPVQLEEKRPVTKRPVVYLVAASGMAMGLLAAGFLVSIGEVILRNPLSKPLWRAALLLLILVWSAWAYLFYKNSAGRAGRDIVAAQRKYLFRGSVLELLVAVPSHLIARQRDYCCAGYSTFFGIAFGLAVMLFSFGPGVLFLYAGRARLPENVKKP